MKVILYIFFSIITAYTVSEHICTDKADDSAQPHSSQLCIPVANNGYIQDTEKALAQCIKSDSFTAPQFGNNAGQKNNSQNANFRKVPDSLKQLLFKKSITAIHCISKSIKLWDISIISLLHEISADYYIISLNKIRC